MVKSITFGILNLFLNFIEENDANDFDSIMSTKKGYFK